MATDIHVRAICNLLLPVRVGGCAAAVVSVSTLLCYVAVAATAVAAMAVVAMEVAAMAVVAMEVAETAAV